MRLNEMGFMQLEVMLGGLILTVAASGLLCIGITEHARDESIGEFTASMMAQEQFARIDDNPQHYAAMRTIPWLGDSARLEQNGKKFQIHTTTTPGEKSAAAGNDSEIFEVAVTVNWQNLGEEKHEGERVWRRYFSAGHRYD